MVLPTGQVPFWSYSNLYLWHKKSESNSKSEDTAQMQSPAADLFEVSAVMPEVGADQSAAAKAIQGEVTLTQSKVIEAQRSSSETDLDDMVVHRKRKNEIIPDLLLPTGVDPNKVNQKFDGDGWEQTDTIDTVQWTHINGRVALLPWGEFPDLATDGWVRGDPVDAATLKGEIFHIILLLFYFIFKIFLPQFYELLN